jgi:hypothetical protein
VPPRGGHLRERLLVSLCALQEVVVVHYQTRGVALQPVDLRAERLALRRVHFLERLHREASAEEV